MKLCNGNVEKCKNVVDDVVLKGMYICTICSKAELVQFVAQVQVLRLAMLFFTDLSMV